MEVTKNRFLHRKWERLCTSHNCIGRMFYNWALISKRPCCKRYTLTVNEGKRALRDEWNISF